MPKPKPHKAAIALTTGAESENIANTAKAQLLKLIPNTGKNLGTPVLAITLPVV
ncbi:Uncharacterised protein [Vibrio cholerae]|nr:Uncharacterised protein [Vibrio cholerae]